MYTVASRMLSPAFRLTGEGGVKLGQSAHIGSPELPSHSVPHHDADTNCIASDPGTSDTIHTDAVSPHTAPCPHGRRGGHFLAFPGIKRGTEGTLPQAPRGVAHPVRPASFPSVARQGLSPGPAPNSRGALLRKAGWFLECGPRLGRGLGSPRTTSLGRGGACGLARGLPVSPFCSELGADSASQDTSPQSACEGGPCRPGPPAPSPPTGLARPTSVPPWGPPCGH